MLLKECNEVENYVKEVSSEALIFAREVDQCTCSINQHVHSLEILGRIACVSHVSSPDHLDVALKCGFF